ncbi:MAG: methyltransferase domain-containing protein [Anaerolineae bacterium]|nr:methyltransferase domain-containing protein [Anaerolineae bacterium]
MASINELKIKYYSHLTNNSLKFKLEAQRLVQPEMAVLHAGCGADISMGLRERTRVTVGIDLDQWIVNNTDLDLGIFGNLEILPLAEDTFDLVLSRWVLEHLEDPETFFSEVSRVLRPDGRLLILTPNMWNYAGLTIMATPHAFQRWFVKTLLKGNPDEVYPVYYRANTRSRLRSLAAQQGLYEESIIFVQGSPDLMGFTKFTYLIGVLYERIVNRFGFLAPFREGILSVYRKNPEVQA